MYGRVPRSWLIALATGAVAVSCSSAEERPARLRPGQAGETGSGGSISIDSGTEPPPPDAPGLCGNEVVPVVIKRPNLYFVLDVSGSMNETLPGTSVTKHEATWVAVRDVLRDIGHRVNYGAAVFPAEVNPDGCAPGGGQTEVLSTVAGDPLKSHDNGRLGPILGSLIGDLQDIVPSGGTPTADTLRRVRGTLSMLSGSTTLVLATDGAPNCNGTLSCDAAHCQHNIEGLFLEDGRQCAGDLNCCDPSLVENGPYYCVDDEDTVAAVDALGQAGIKTYVVGMPGSEHYAGLLDRLAVTGRTARSGAPRYYAVVDTAELASALREIGVEVTASCRIELDTPPPDQGKVNVYLDSRLIPSNLENGWTWTSDRSLELRGSACADLQSGDIQQVQVVAGCPTSTVF